MRWLRSRLSIWRVGMLKREGGMHSSMLSNRNISVALGRLKERHNGT